jgi:hypothetical protein
LTAPSTSKEWAQACYLSLSGRAAQVRFADSLQGLQQRSRVRSPDPQAPNSSVLWHQATTDFWRFQGHHRASQQGVDCVKDTMDAYCTEICKLEGHFEGIEFQHIPRNNNVAADILSKLGSRRALVPARVFVQYLRKPSIKLLDPDNPVPTTS